MIWKKIAFFLYPILIGFLLPVLFYLGGNSGRSAQAGIIRNAALSPEHPLIVRLAMGRSTAITFATRPEKVVPGNPQSLEINFLGRDLTLRPLGRLPGNLIVYTKSGRYVILLHIASESSYDDAVVVNGVSSRSKVIRLAEDAFTIEEVKITDLTSHKDAPIAVLVRHGGKVLESDTFPAGLRCKGCVLKHNELICGFPVSRLVCKVGNTIQVLERRKAGN